MLMIAADCTPIVITHPTLTHGLTVITESQHTQPTLAHGLAVAIILINAHSLVHGL